MLNSLPVHAASPVGPALRSSPGRSKSLLLKAVRRFVRTATAQIRGFVKRQSSVSRIIVLSVALFFFFLAGQSILALRRSLASLKTGPLTGNRREDLHFSRVVHLRLSRQRPFSEAVLAPCSWLYLEVNAYDGRDVNGFFTNANDIFEDPMRSEIAPSRAFCAVVLESDPSQQESLLAVRAEKGLFTRSFDVYPSTSVRSHAPSRGERYGASFVVLSSLIERTTFNLSESGLSHDEAEMVVAKANGHVGTVFVRLSGSMAELFAHLDGLRESDILCSRVDRLVLNVTGDVRDIQFSAPYSPSSEKYNPSLGVAGLEAIAEDYSLRKSCRTRLFVFDVQGGLVVPQPLSERGVFYSILAGAPTFDERILAQTDSWLTAVPKDRVGIFTNHDRSADDLYAAQGRPVVVVQPHNAGLEQKLEWMQSWSHLVRVRETWDKFMNNDSSIKWLALVDDDTFVFPAGMREYLTMFDHRVPFWGGSGELARIDNGDHGEFALWLRNKSLLHGGEHCYLATEEVPVNLQGEHTEIVKSAVMNGRRSLKKVSHMCHDNFCRRGCPSVPQGATIVLSRALVERIRPYVESCEAATSNLCSRCGSQRLYMCVNTRVHGARTLLTRGVCRAPWKLEHRASFRHALSYHGFTSHGRITSENGNIYDDMRQLWELGRRYEGREAWQGTVPMRAVASHLGCNGEGIYNITTGLCD